ncbi:MAG TPA: response regulator [Acidimicrobiales bacterium]|nr:response regulator [Acidimicrobiales bacterium]
MAVRAVVIDDSDDIRLLLRMALGADGFEIVGEAVDGRAGIEVVAGHQPDAVILDVMMPVMNGLDALPEIRRVAPGTPVVLYSSVGTDEMDERARDADAVVVKEAGVSRLAVTLREILARKVPSIL